MDGEDRNCMPPDMKPDMSHPNAVDEVGKHWRMIRIEPGEIPAAGVPCVNYPTLCYVKEYD